MEMKWIKGGKDAEDFRKRVWTSTFFFFSSWKPFCRKLFNSETNLMVQNNLIVIQVLFLSYFLND